MDVIKQYEDYIGLKKEYIKNPTLENKNAMIAKLEEYGKYIYDQCNRLRKDCIVEEEKEVLEQFLLLLDGFDTIRWRNLPFLKWYKKLFKIG